MSLLGFNWENQQNALSALTDQLNHLLARQGFQRIEKRKWERDRGWISEGVYLTIRQAPTWDFDVHFITYFPYRPADRESDEPRLIFAQTTGFTVAGHDSVFVRLPRYSFFITRFVRHTIREIEQALTWFDQFATPSQCIAAIDRVHNPGCLAHKWATEYLSSVAETAQQNHGS